MRNSQPKGLKGMEIFLNTTCFHERWSEIMDRGACLLEQPHLPGLVKPQCSPSPPAGGQRPGGFTRQTLHHLFLESCWWGCHTAGKCCLCLGHQAGVITHQVAGYQCIPRSQHAVDAPGWMEVRGESCLYSLGWSHTHTLPKVSCVPFLRTTARILDSFLAFSDVSSLRACVLSHSSCVQFFVNYDCSLPGSSVYEIPQARILEWVVISFSRRSSWPRDQIHISCIAGGFFTPRATWEACIFPTREQSQEAHCRVSLS